MKFEEWLDEIEVFSARWERLHSDFSDLTVDEIDLLMKWLRAAYDVGYFAGNENKKLTTS